MKKFTQTFVLAAAALATVFATVPAAEAGHRGWRHHHHHSNNNGDALAAGVLGLATGAIIGGVIANSGPRYVEPRRVYTPQPTYYPPAPTYVAPPRPAYYPRPVSTYGGYEPWSPGWYNYCSQRYRSFDPSTGTFRGYDGRDHFCAAN